VRARPTPRSRERRGPRRADGPGPVQGTRGHGAAGGSSGENGAGVRRLFLDLCTPDELETVVRVWERISPGCTGVTATPGTRVRSGPPG